MEYEEIREIKKSDKSVVHLVREKGGNEVYVRKILKGRHEVYRMLQNCPHPFLPEIYGVTVSENDTTVIEEYIEGKLPDARELSMKQIHSIAVELCRVLEFIHEKGIIHRDIKPSNILLAKDGHIRLIDFDAARVYKEVKEQDTRLLGTRGYAPPEQYGFNQTDERADIYSMGVTLDQLLVGKNKKYRYRKIIQKCTRLDPDKRYQTARQVRMAFSQGKWIALCGVLALFLIAILWKVVWAPSARNEETSSMDAALQVLPAPENPRWDGETGIGLWSNVAESGIDTESSVHYKYKLCRRDTADPPGVEDDVWEKEDDDLRGNLWNDIDGIPTFDWNFTAEFWENGFYYFAVAAVGDGVRYADSPYVVSDAFAYTGADAPALPTPTGLCWKMRELEQGWAFFATWDNMEDYGDLDSFNVTVYNKNNEYVTNNIWTKEYMMEKGYDGVRIRPEFMAEKGEAYRFTVEVQSSRPNEHKSSPMPEPPTEEYFSPWYYYSNENL